MYVHANLIANILTCLAYDFQYSQSLMKTWMSNLLPGFRGVPVAQSLASCVVFFRSLFVLCSLSLAIVLSVLLLFTYSDYPFDIFKLFLEHTTHAPVLPVI